MKPPKWPSIPFVITDFSPTGITLNSRRDNSFLICFLGFAGSFLLAGGLTAWLGGSSWNFQPILLCCLVGLLSLAFVFGQRNKAIRIQVDPKERIISGLSIPVLSFSRISSVLMTEEDGMWNLEIEMEGSGSIDFVKGLPLDLAVCLGSHAGHLIARPFKIPKTFKITGSYRIDWRLPYESSEFRYPVGWMILSSAIAVLGMILVLSGRSDFFNRFFWPRWAAIPLLAFPGMYLVSAIDFSRHAKWLAPVFFAVMAILIFTGVIALNTPVQVLEGLTPGLAVLMLAAGWHIGIRHSVPLYAAGTLLLLLGGVYSVLAFMTYNSVRTLDPGVIEQVIFPQMPESMESSKPVVLDRPEDIRPLVEAIRDVSLHELDRAPKTNCQDMNIMRPFGKDTYLRLQRQGSGDRTLAVVAADARLIGFRVLTIYLSSTRLDSSLTEILSDDGLWPPRYGK